MANSKLHEQSGVRQFTDNGVIAGGALIYVYDAGTTDLQTLYSDSALTVPTTNPVVASASGVTEHFYVGTTSYKTRITESGGTLIGAEVDNVPGATDLDSLSTDFSKPSTAVSVKSADYTVLEADLGSVIQVDTSGGNYTVTLVSAVTAGNGKGVTIAHTGSQNTVTIATVSSQTIIRKGGSTESTQLFKLGDSITLVSNGASWVVYSEANETPTGCMEPFLGTAAPGGWVLGSGDTIGNASSSATERAHADTEALFTLLWDSFADAQCAVSSGRGASASADFAANKNIALPDLRGRSFFGLDNIGGSAASRLGNVITNETVNGASGGSETHALSEAELAQHDHPASTTINNGTGKMNVTGNGGVPAGSGFNLSSTTSTITASTTVSNAGSGNAHTNMPPAWLGNWIIKL